MRRHGKCKKCGLCCRILRPNCKYYDAETNLCKVHGTDKQPQECKDYPGDNELCEREERLIPKKFPW